MLAHRIRFNDWAGIKDPTLVDDRKRTAYIHSRRIFKAAWFPKEHQVHPSGEIWKSKFDRRYGMLSPDQVSR